MVTQEKSRDNYIPVFLPLEMINYVNYFAGKHGISKDSAVRALLLKNYEFKNTVIKDYTKKKYEELLVENLTKNTIKRDNNIKTENEKLKSNLKDLELKIESLKREKSIEFLKAESYAMQSKSGLKNTKIKEQKEVEKRKTIKKLVKDIEDLKEQGIQKLIQNEKYNIRDEYLAIENLRKQLIKLKHYVKEVDTDDLLQDPRVQQAKKDRETKAEERRKAYREQQRKEIERLENLKKTDCDQWIRELLERTGLKFSETENEIRVLNCREVEDEQLKEHAFKLVEFDEKGYLLLDCEVYWSYQKQSKKA